MLENQVQGNFFIGNKPWAESNLTSRPTRSCDSRDPARSCDLAHGLMLEPPMKC